MKKIYVILSLILLTTDVSFAQPVVWAEGFEGYDSLTLPAGWTRVNNSTNPIEPEENWTIRPVGLNLPGLSTSLSVVHSGAYSIGISWVTGNPSGFADCWLVTKKIKNVASDAYMSFWATGGSPTYSDSFSVWVSTTDSLPSSFLSNPNGFIQSFFFPVGSTYGQFQQSFVDLFPFAGQDIYVGFRYNMDVAVDGYYVQMDDVEYAGTVGISQIGTNVPDKFSLNQNYPNPFNPTTKINFDLAKVSNVKLTVFNSLGQIINTLFDGQKPAGSYQAEFDASRLSSGTYFYRLETESFVETKKMQLIK